jgi:hypothetical protein
LHFDLIWIGWYDDFNCHPLFAKFDENSNTTFFAPSAIRERCSDFHKASLARPSTPESCRIQILPPPQLFGQALHEPVPGAASVAVLVNPATPASRCHFRDGAAQGHRVAERADVTSNTYYDWLIDHVFLLVPAQEYVGQFLATFSDFPPRQKAATFNMDEVLSKLKDAK